MKLFSFLSGVTATFLISNFAMAASFKIQMVTAFEKGFGSIELSPSATGDILVDYHPQTSSCSYSATGTLAPCMTPHYALPTYTVKVEKTEFGLDFEIPEHKFRLVTHGDSPKLLALDKRKQVQSVYELHYRFFVD